jgi:uncharacterized membrane protein HdeD (DUF308 family)
MKKLQKLANWILLLAAVCLVILGLTLLFTPPEKLAGLTVYIAWTLVMAGLAEALILYDRLAGPWFLASGLVKAQAPAWLLAGGLIRNWLAILILLTASLQIVAVQAQKELYSWSLTWPASLAMLLAIPLVLRLLSGQVAVFCSGLMLIACGLATLLLFFNLWSRQNKDRRIHNG